MLPTIAPALRAQIRSAEADRRDHQRTETRAGLADPRVAAARIAHACLARTERTLYTRWRAISFLVRVRYED